MLALLGREATSVWEEVLLHDADCLLPLLETGQVFLAHHHHLDQDYDLVCVLLQRHEASLEVFAELLELFRRLTTKDINELLSQLEGGLLKLESLARVT